MAKSTKSEVRVTSSLIDFVMTDYIDNGRYDYVKTIMRYAQKQSAENAWHRLGQAYLHAGDARTAKTDFDFKPEPVMSAIQQLCNSMVYVADRMYSQFQNADESEVLTGGNGRDFYAEYCEELGIEPVDEKNIIELVHEDFRRLTEVYEIMRKQCSRYLPNLPQLYLLSTDQPDPDDETAPWIEKHRLSDLPSALDAIRADRIENAERQREETANEFMAVA